MNQFNFENQGTNTYLVYEIALMDQVDNMSLGMLTNNKIVGLAPTIFTQFDTTKYIKYNVTSRVSASQFLSGPINKTRLLGVLCGIVNGLLAIEDYMIDINSVVLDLDYIFVDVSNYDTVMICLPIVRAEMQNTDLTTFFKDIVFNVQYDQTEQNNSYVAAIMNYLNSVPSVALLEFKNLLDGLHRENGLSENLQQMPVGSAAVQSGFGFQAQAAPVQQMASNPVSAPQQAVSAPASVPQQQTAGVQANPENMTPPMFQPLAQAQMSVQNSQPMTQTQVKANAKKGAASAPEVTVPGAPSGMVIPGVPAGIAVPLAPAEAFSMNNAALTDVKNAAEQGKEKKISVFYLLQHYNKENAALYKAQKEAKKAAKGQPKAQSAQPMGVPTPQSMQFSVPQSENQIQQQAGQATMNSVQQPVGQLGINPVSSQLVGQAGMNPASQQMVQPSVQSIPNPVSQQAQPVAQPQPDRANFGETVVLNAGNMGETSVLNQAAATVENRPHLIRMKNNERINLDKPVFRIGKERSYVDYFIGDNTAVSRSHANFITRDGEYFVMDTNSTNHTYINGQMIQSNVEAKLTHKTKVRLANEEFEFRLY